MLTNMLSTGNQIVESQSRREAKAWVNIRLSRQINAVLEAEQGELEREVYDKGRRRQGPTIHSIVIDVRK